ncbi:ribosomal RNA adenine methylase transferase [Purpureocillium lavendulum]|uniref:Ribosomal RNA adenine methylase transferase n=1 Tax=Purpureocillium lavendulum TaxID=1247861 RepID=A0AB34FQA9_9HYPO|nr:ribosomal RNA adenine methylase transferase [Purpureocillium lavendulum]
MQAAITLLLLCAGLAVGRPAVQAVGPCTKLSSSTTKWDVVDFGYSATSDSSAGSKANATTTDGSGGTIRFRLANAAVEYKANCSAQSADGPDFFDGKREYACSVPVQGDKATFTFSRQTGRLHIKQMWRCAKEFTGFQAEGGIALNLTCGEGGQRRTSSPLRRQTAVSKILCDNSPLSVPIENLSAFA